MRVSLRHLGNRALTGLLLLAATHASHAASIEALSWGSADIAGKPNPRAALIGTALIDGHSCGMQIDTGANAAVVWHQDQKDAATQAVSVAFAGRTVKSEMPAALLQQLEKCEPGAVIGTLGNAFFEQGTLEIDLGKPALRYSAGTLLGKEKTAMPLFYARWAGEGGHPLVEVRDDVSLLGYALLDTGSAAVGIGVLSLEQWNRLTANAPLQNSESVETYPVRAWGKEHSCFFYKKRSAVQIDDMRPRQLTVQYCPTLGFKPGIELVGVLGLQFFSKETIIIDYVAGRWMMMR